MSARDTPHDSMPKPELLDLTRSMELVQAYQAGDAEALNDLFRRYEARLRRIVRIKMGPKLRRFFEPDDVMQDVFVVAIKQVEKMELRSHASILQLLSKIALNQLRDKADYANAQQRDPARERRLDGNSQDEDSNSGLVLPHTGPSPSQIVRHKEMEEIIDEELERLEPADYREVILQREYFDEDWPAIAESLERPTVAAVQELYRRAKMKLTKNVRPRLESTR